tara:strand:+ start:622 stop:993 length:372 start_codon:yes stop_codon:yes gene_type:complete
MEIFTKLPAELKYYILYDCMGIEHKTARIMKEFINDNWLYKTEQFKEPNFYEFLKVCNILNEIGDKIRIWVKGENGEYVVSHSYYSNDFSLVSDLYSDGDISQSSFSSDTDYSSDDFIFHLSD